MATSSHSVNDDRISSAGRIFLVAWVIGLLVLLAAVLWATALPLRQSKLSFGILAAGYVVLNVALSLAAC